MGLRNNGRFLRDLLAHPAFREARMHTTLIDDWAGQAEPLLVAPPISDSTWRLAAAVLATRDGGSRRPASVAAWDLTLQAGDERRILRVWPQGQRIDVTANGSTTTIELGSWVGHRLRYADQGVQHDVVCVPDGDALHVVQDGTVATLREVSPWPSTDTAVDPRLARAPVAGTVAADQRRAGRPGRGRPAARLRRGDEDGNVAGAPAAVAACAPSTCELRQSVEAQAVLVELEIEEKD